MSGTSKQRKNKIISDDGATLGFVSPTVSFNGHLSTVQKVEDALVVEFTPSHEAQEITLASDRHLGPNRTRLGLTWAWFKDNPRTITQALLDGEKDYAYGGLALLTYDHASSTFKSSATVYTGEIGLDVWHILVDGTMLLTWQAKPGVQFYMTMNLTLAKKSLNYAFDHDSYVASAPSDWKKRLVFQPL